MELVWWTLEEPPAFRRDHMGSAVHAKKLAAEGVKVSAAISIETVGFFTDADDSQHFPVPFLAWLYPTRGNTLALVSNTGADNISLVRRMKAAMRGVDALPIQSFNAPVAIPGTDWSDHRSYWPYDIPALMVTDTALNRNANYHHATDIPETLNFAQMANVTEAVFEGLWALY